MMLAPARATTVPTTERGLMCEWNTRRSRGIIMIGLSDMSVEAMPTCALCTATIESQTPITGPVSEPPASHRRV